MNQFLNNKNKRNGWIKIVVGIIILVLFVVILNLFSARIRNFFYSASLPIQKIFSDTGSNMASVLASVFNYKNLQKENEDLKNENQKLLSQMARFYDLTEQNQAIKDILACSQEGDFNLVLADITGFDLKEGFALINKGKDNGISENMAVVSSQKVLFGRVFKVYKNYSQVMLISNKNSILDVKISRLERDSAVAEQNDASIPVYGVVKGKGGFSVYLDLVPTDLKINNGDILITSALEGIFPKDLLVGEIKEKEKNDLKPFQTASVNPFFDIKKIEKVFIITNYKQE
jgi:rod shape-determining protein MreC